MLSDFVYRNVLISLPVASVCGIGNVSDCWIVLLGIYMCYCT